MSRTSASISASVKNELRPGGQGPGGAGGSTAYF